MSDTVDPGPTTSQPKPPTPVGAFPRLSDEQIDVLLERGRRRRLAKGEVLIRPGDHPSSPYVVLNGYLLTTDLDRRPAPSGRAGDGGRARPGRRFVGDVGRLCGRAALVARCPPSTPPRSRTPVEELEAIVASDPLLGEDRACAPLSSDAPSPSVSAPDCGWWGPASPHKPVTCCASSPATRSPTGWWTWTRTTGAAGPPAGDVWTFPLVILGGSRTVRAATQAPAAGLGEWPTTCDVVGAGPAGLATAVRHVERLSVYLCDSVATGGQAGTSRKSRTIGFPAGISGAELAKPQACPAGSEVRSHLGHPCHCQEDRRGRRQVRCRVRRRP